MAQVGKGTTLSVADSLSGSYTVIAEVTDTNLPEIISAMVESTHYTSPNSYVTKISSEWKEVSPINFTLNYTTENQTALIALVGDDSKYYKITLGGGDYYRFGGSLSALGGSPIPIKDRVLNKGTITPTGEIFYSPAS